VPFPALWGAVCKLAEACGWEPEPEPGPAEKPQEEGPARAAGWTFRALPGVEARAVAYLAKCDAAISGRNGHDKAYWPARAVVHGFALGPEVGFDILWEHFNPRCEPRWSEKELRHKCRDANRLPFKKARGWLLKEAEEFSNYEMRGEGDDAKKVGLSAAELDRRLAGLTAGWPKRAGGRLFAPDAGHKALWLESADALFAWIGRQLPHAAENGVRWVGGEDKVTQAQFHAHLRQAAEAFESVESAPHEPPVAGNFYLHPPVKGGDGKALQALLGRFSPATDVD
jgi:hypothetical protein